jgi:hypothetical protein
MIRDVSGPIPTPSSFTVEVHDGNGHADLVLFFHQSNGHVARNLAAALLEVANKLEKLTT